MYLCLKVTSVPHHVGLSLGCLGVLMTRQLASPTMSDLRESEEEALAPSKT